MGIKQKITDTKLVMTSGNFKKNRQYNGQTKKDTETNNDL